MSAAATIRSASPQAPDDVLGEFPIATPEQVRDRVAAGRRAAREWWALGAAGRSAALGAAARELRGARAEATALVVREVGKPQSEAAGEVARAIAILEYYAQTAFLPVGENLPPSAGGLLLTERRPHGVAALIAPWNFPLAIPLWKAAPALACGNAVVLKPSPEAPACAEFLHGIFAPHLPVDLVGVVHGDASAAEALIDTADIVSFTGSDRVGRLVAARAGGRGIPVQCEMGGQNAAIVLPDAEPEATAAMLAGAAMGFAGQKCTATRRVIVVGKAEPFAESLVTAVEAIAPNEPDSPATVAGPLISEAARHRVAAAIASASAAGARLLTGGGQPERAGWFIEPTVLDGVAPDAPFATEEVFGPVLSLHAVPDLESAISLANGVRFGLVTSVHGRDSGQLLHAASALDTGLIKLNAPTTGVDFYAPFGGEKASSIGPREQGLAALAFYSTLRTITFAAGT